MHVSHPCIFIYHHCIFISCFVFFLFWYHSHTLWLTTTWWGWGHKTIYFVCRFSRKDKKINLSLLIPREFDINSRVIPRGETVFPILYTLHLESQPNPYSFDAGNYVKGHQDNFLAPLPGNHCWKDLSKEYLTTKSTSSPTCANT